MKPAADRPRHFSMIREFHLADFFTLANAACGVAGVFCAMVYVGNQSSAYFFAAAALAPAALGFAAGLRGGLDWVALIYFVCCGVSRLARYNVTAEKLSGDAGKVAYFEGTPIPTSVLLTGVLALAAWYDRVDENILGGVWALGPWELHPLSLMFVLSGTLMVSKTLRIPKL
jgi:CDP-diacylglycerol--serine O-phosphatidyltransferase